MRRTLTRIEPGEGLAWITPTPAEFADLDAASANPAERLVIHEDGRPLGPPDALHADIAALGGGRYSHWGEHVWFSTSDGSDPRVNGRSYSLSLGDDPRIEQALAHLRPGLGAPRREAVRSALRTIVASGQVDTIDEVDRRAPVRGAALLEVGCGQCWSAPFFLSAGARSYHGIELMGPPDDRRVFDRRHAHGMWTDEHYLELPLSLTEFLDSFEGLTYTAADFTDTRLDGGAFDVAFMRVVSEHLLEPRKCVREIHRLLRTGGRLYLSHGLYSAWNGHHQPPHNVTEFDPDDPAMRAVADWAHLETLVENDRDDGHNLNYLRIHELAALLRAFFEIEGWELAATPDELGRTRFREELLAHHPEYYREELLTDLVYATCVKRSAAPTDVLGLAETDAPPAAVERWLEQGGDTLALSRATGWPLFELVALRESRRKRAE